MSVISQWCGLAGTVMLASYRVLCRFASIIDGRKQTRKMSGNKLCGRPPQYTPASCDLDLWPFDLESSVRVTCAVDYFCSNFSLPRPLCSRLRPDVPDRQTDVRRQTVSSLNAPPRVKKIKCAILLLEFRRGAHLPSWGHEPVGGNMCGRLSWLNCQLASAR